MREAHRQVAEHSQKVQEIILLLNPEQIKTGLNLLAYAQVL